jgi:two-component system, NtrC family, nitrogen regulation response regulator GlnG
MEKILLVEADAEEARALASFLAPDYRVQHCPEPARAPDEARRSTPDAVLLGLPPRFGPRGELIRKTARESGGAPLIVLSPESHPSDVVDCMRSGAFDFMAKPCRPDELRRSLGSAVAPKLLHGARSFIGSSRAIQQVEELIRLYADSDYPVLVRGESGTGKEIAARSLRDLSRSRRGPFIARNCAAIPEHLVESELFGTERGAFTDAVSRPGAFELARGGLLFLDEIGEAGLPFQSKLLRVLETGEFWRLGSSSNGTIDFRFVSATGRDLEAAAAAGAFRLDLLYRIDTLKIEMPALRSRREDIAPLAEHFAHAATRGRTAIGPSALDKLSAHEWPGNIRQLRNVVHRAIVLAGHAELLEARHIVF